jgi:hypothetical protein
MSLREQMERDLAVTLERPEDWGMPVELIGPDGKEYKTSANSSDPENPDPLYGQVHYASTHFSPETGEDTVVNKPTVVLRRSSLERIPEDGENWHVRFPKDPSLTATMRDYVLTRDKATEGGRSIGFIRLYPTKAVQKTT